jgi:hypothetical protein
MLNAGASKAKSLLWLPPTAGGGHKFTVNSKLWRNVADASIRPDHPKQDRIVLATRARAS